MRDTKWRKCRSSKGDCRADMQGGWNCQKEGCWMGKLRGTALKKSKEIDWTSLSKST
jgi:hypothetical protein